MFVRMVLWRNAEVAPFFGKMSFFLFQQMFWVMDWVKLLMSFLWGKKSRRVTPCAAKAGAVRPAAGGRRSKNVGLHQHPGPENQDSQHMIDQPRRSFPDLQETGEVFLLTVGAFLLTVKLLRL